MSRLTKKAKPLRAVINLALYLMTLLCQALVRVFKTLKKTNVAYLHKLVLFLDSKRSIRHRLPVTGPYEGSRLRESDINVRNLKIPNVGSCPLSWIAESFCRHTKGARSPLQAFLPMSRLIRLFQTLCKTFFERMVPLTCTSFVG